ncbi:nitroreductase family protein [Saccharopolyspora rosea]|uniref:Nitroreductase family protein n=1 Tax=Saccharopolyspora rosea TaxID=524884 RepID=A0ABW3FM85_9PSEU|nr:nitroreductase family protein [Saccharopolyspora rosea]
MEFKKVVGTRRSIRYYQPWRPVDEAKIQKVLEAARLQSQHGNAQLIRKAVVVIRDETPEQTWNALVEALYNQPAAAQAPVHVYWTIDMSGWENLRDELLKLIEAGALTSSYGWSEQFVDDVVMKTPDFNVLAGDMRFAEWLSAIETGLAIGSALLAAVDEGLGTGMLTGKRDRIRELLGMPEHATPAQVQLLGYPAEDREAGGQRPRPDFEQLYFRGTWGTSFERDPEVVRELTEAGAIQEAAPLHWRKAEVRALAGLFGLPE